MIFEHLDDDGIGEGQDVTGIRPVIIRFDEDEPIFSVPELTDGWLLNGLLR